MEKICAICGEKVPNGLIKCPRCGRGTFASEKKHEDMIDYPKNNNSKPQYDTCNFCGRKPTGRFTFVPASNRGQVEGEIGHPALTEPYTTLDGKPFLAVCPACWAIVTASRPKCPRCGASGYGPKAGLTGVQICSSCGYVGP